MKLSYVRDVGETSPGVSLIGVESHEDEGSLGVVWLSGVIVLKLSNPLVADTRERRRLYQREAHHEAVRLRVRKRSHPIVFWTT